MPIKEHKRQYDLVILGASGHTGNLTALNVATRLPTNLRWALAGRSESKLQAVADECKKENSDRSQPALEVANADDEGQLLALAKKTCVLISTVGPFALYGEPVLRVCAQAGTHYLDCTGEAAWVARMIKKYSKTARETGAIMVPQNGIESAPADLCTWSLARFLAAEMGAKTKDVAIVTQEMRGRFSKGTLVSALGYFDHFSFSELNALNEPYSMSPIPHPEQARPSKTYMQQFLGIRDIPGLGMLTTSVAGMVDVTVVERSWGLLFTIPSRRDQFYGPKFNWAEYSKPRNWFQGVAIHWGVVISKLLLSLVPPVRRFALKVIERSNHGQQDRDEIAMEKIEYRGLATPDTEQPSEKKAFCRAWFNGGLYYLTGTFLAKAALTILEDDLQLDGGIYTPACLGQGYIDRVREAGFKIEVSMVDS